MKCDGVVGRVWAGEVMNLVEIELPISKMSFDSRASPQTPWRRVRKFLPFFCTRDFLLYANGSILFFAKLVQTSLKSGTNQQVSIGPQFQSILVRLKK